MKRKLKFIFILAISIWLVDLLLFHSINYMYKRMMVGQSGGKINYYLEKTNVKHLLIMGNSRVYNQIIPDSIDVDSYNLGHAGMKQSFQTGLLSILEKRNKIPHTVLLHLEPSEISEGANDKSIQKLKYYYGINEDVTHYINKISFYERFKFAFKTYRFNGQLLNIIKTCFFSTNDGEDVLYKGWRRITSTGRDSLNVMYSQREYAKQEVPVFDKNNIESLVRFINICKRNNVRIICFTSPEFKPQKTEIENSKKLQEELTKLKIQYINYLVNPIPELIGKPSFWKDAMHLNENGAAIESRDLGVRIKNYKFFIPIEKSK